MKEILIDGVVYVPKTQDSPIKIAILQRGLVVIGRYQIDGNNVQLSDAYIIRRWGTTRGLGELAKEGAKENTILDEVGTVRCDYLTVVATIDCNQSIWNNKL